MFYNNTVSCLIPFCIYVVHFLLLHFILAIRTYFQITLLLTSLFNLHWHFWRTNCPLGKLNVSGDLGSLTPWTLGSRIRCQSDLWTVMWVSNMSKSFSMTYKPASVRSHAPYISRAHSVIGFKTQYILGFLKKLSF